MKPFVEPKLEIININSSEDVINTSGLFGEQNPAGVLGETDL